MARKRVAVLSNRNLLMAGVVTMLKEQSGLEVRTIATDDDTLARQLSAFKPEVLVLDGGDMAFASRFPLESLLQSHGNPTVIALTLERNGIRAYRHQWVVHGTAV